jgi:hypothetical protein
MGLLGFCCGPMGWIGLGVCWCVLWWWSFVGGVFVDRIKPEEVGY